MCQCFRSAVWDRFIGNMTNTQVLLGDNSVQKNNANSLASQQLILDQLSCEIIAVEQLCFVFQLDKCKQNVILCAYAINCEEAFGY